jgi:crotonobetainyl-CoA:carnitine CoA-transferase CaiB-like acyl-CoA transferase
VPCAPVRDLEDALDVQRLRERDMLAAFDHPELGAVRSVGLPLQVANFTPRYRAAPALGADTAALLAETGYEEQEIARLAAAGAFGRS